MGKDLKGKELGVGISQRSDGFYVGRFTAKYGQRKQKSFCKLQECRQWLADSQYQDEHSNLNFPEEMTVKAWFYYWIDMKKRMVRPNTVRNYTKCYECKIDPVIGKQILSEEKTIQCQIRDSEVLMHALRHTFATRCIEGDMKPTTLQTILGHSNIGITMNL